jgi:hypothetical protein
MGSYETCARAKKFGSPGTEDFLDPAAYALNAVIPTLQFLQGAIPVTAPHAGLDYVRKSAFGLNRSSERLTSVTAICIDGARIVRQRAMPCASVMNITWRN